ncbi:nitrilase-related carbon-nitrogen hydrolase [Methanohalophilus mahii]|uniref:Nitrilase/cyanide hydratase and apolipoprotein N-acyltransferase n=1 Tax=Methanohalophilus mahii (strain ATCC 35705 / DSM 5219 / SLP) TaxID=547558 RepID=D5EAP0_METMS|nr:nitrilase-related carbon-nitrogen hydrolase [Methanohalophilus mahii]ADE36241.1 Nitrilase/cyanide hydratase and apolipoprotein N-acyltransferase [Methanohalophilus mahii DSM 5219]
MVKVACIQMDVEHCNKKTNIERALARADRALTMGAEIIVFPEVFSTGFCYEQMDKLAEKPPYPTIGQLVNFSQKNNCILIGSIVEELDAETKPYANLGFCIENGIIRGTYRKIHPFGEEKSHFTPGDSIHPIKLENICIGLEICYEIRFPEVARKLVLQGADLLVTIAQFPDPRGNHWRILGPARAVENQIPHVMCNRTGKDPTKSFPGSSMIIDALGNTLADSGRDECIIMADIDLSLAKELSSKIPVLDDRREDLYSN